MTNLTQLQMITVPKEWWEKFEKQVWDNCVEDGRNAYRAGLPENHPLGRMIDPDMSVSWKMGWHQAREADAKIKRMRC